MSRWSREECWNQPPEDENTAEPFDAERWKYEMGGSAMAFPPVYAPLPTTAQLDALASERPVDPQPTDAEIDEMARFYDDRWNGDPPF